MILNDKFDKIFCHNLDRSEYRWFKMKGRFDQYNIEVTRMPAIDGKTLPIYEKWNALSVNQQQILQRPTAYAIIQTYIKTIEHCVENGYENVLLFEDDVTFHKDFDKLIDDHMGMLPDDWDMVWFGGTQHDYDNVGSQVNDGFKIASGVDGLLAVGIKRKMFQPLLDLWESLNHTADSIIMSNIQTSDKYNCYASTPRLFGHEDGYSFNFNNIVRMDMLPKNNMLYYDKNVYV